MISVTEVAKSFGAVEALAPTTLAFAPGRTTVVIGPSGCGKTTLLRLMLGLVTPDGGSVMLNGATLSTDNAQTLRHRVGYVIQEGGLFPHLSARRNVTLMARYLGRSQSDIERRCTELAELVQWHFFAGISFVDIASARGVTERTVRRHWDLARLFLADAIGSAAAPASGPRAATTRPGTASSRTSPRRGSTSAPCAACRVPVPAFRRSSWILPANA